MDAMTLMNPLAGGWSGAGAHPVQALTSLAGSRLNSANPFDTSDLQRVLWAGEFSTQRLLMQITVVLAGLLRNDTKGASDSANRGGTAPPSTDISNSNNASSGSDSSTTLANATGNQVQRPGGKIDSSIAPSFDAMVAAAKKDGIDLQIESGWRSRAEQEVLYQKYLNGTGNLAAKPGTSNHESGQAIDFKNTPGAFDWLKKNAEKFGFQNLPGEPWHYSVNGK